MIQKRDKCVTVRTTTYTSIHTLTNIETDIWIERKREANVFFWIIYSGKLLLKKQKAQQYQSWVIAIIKHNYIHSFLIEKHFSSFFHVFLWLLTMVLSYIRLSEVWNLHLAFPFDSVILSWYLFAIGSGVHEFWLVMYKCTWQLLWELLI